MRLEIPSGEWQAVGISVTTKSDGYPAVRILIPYSESARDLLRKALDLLESGLATRKEADAKAG